MSFPITPALTVSGGRTLAVRDRNLALYPISERRYHFSMQSVYVETTIPSYLVGRKSKAPNLRTDQDATQEWWDNQRLNFRLFTSVFTHDEAGRGDAALAAERLAKLKGIPTLDIPEGFEQLEGNIVRLFQLPERASTDASHLALAIVHQMDYLLTWNCTHLANAVLQKELIDYCGYYGFHVPVICTPLTLTRLTKS